MRCKSKLKKNSIPPRSVKNFKLLTDETFMKFFRPLDRLQARLIAKVIPITTINIQKVYGTPSQVIHAKTTNNTISLRAAPSKVLEQLLLPRSIYDTGTYYFRSRCRQLTFKNVNDKYTNVLVDINPVIKALAVLTGAADGLTAPLNKYYKSNDLSESSTIHLQSELHSLNNHPPTIDITEDDNDDDINNDAHQMKRKISCLFGGKSYEKKNPKAMGFNSRFCAHHHVKICSATVY
jgi:hypothetical protein